MLLFKGLCRHLENQALVEKALDGRMAGVLHMTEAMILRAIAVIIKNKVISPESGDAILVFHNKFASDVHLECLYATFHTTFKTWRFHSDALEKKQRQLVVGPIDEQAAEFDEMDVAGPVRVGSLAEQSFLPAAATQGPDEIGTRDFADESVMEAARDINSEFSLLQYRLSIAQAEVSELHSRLSRVEEGRDRYAMLLQQTNVIEALPCPLMQAIDGAVADHGLAMKLGKDVLNLTHQNALQLDELVGLRAKAVEFSSGLSQTKLRALAQQLVLFCRGEEKEAGKKIGGGHA
jgi:hypothetical protein